jgi:uncharacterized protein (TIGR03435 family)
MARFTGIGIALTFVLLGLSSMSGQSNAPAAFEVADIHLRARPVGGLPAMTAPMLRGGRYDVRAATLLDLIRTAYGIDKDRILGGPSWLDWNRFDIVARTAPSTTPAMIPAMLRSLLADRFHLIVRPNTKPLPGYALVLDAGRTALEHATSSDREGGGCTPQPNEQAGGVPLAVLGCRGATMEDFVATLRARAGGYLDGQIVDATNLAGRWDFDLRWTPKLVLGRAGAEGVTLAAALDRQLGLKLDARMLDMPVLIVEAADETPTPNPSGVARDLPAPPPAEFDVANIKISPSDAPTSGRLQPGGRLDLQGMTMKTLIRLAWSLNDDELLAGGPSWLDTTKYSVVARSTSAIGGVAGNLQIDIDDLRLMLRALLIQRFALTTHFEDRPVSAYTLVADKPKLTPADPSRRTNCREGVEPGARDPRTTSPMLSRLVTCQNMTLRQFAEDVPRIAGGYIHVPVVDATGLDGAWDFTLNFSPSGQVNNTQSVAAAAAPGQVPVAADPNGALSLFDAVEKQLGLKLEMRKRPMPVLVIDRVDEQPSGN